MTHNQDMFNAKKKMIQKVLYVGIVGNLMILQMMWAGFIAAKKIKLLLAYQRVILVGRGRWVNCTLKGMVWAKGSDTVDIYANAIKEYLNE